MEPPTDAADDLERHALRLFRKHWNGEPVRLLGIAVSKLVEKDHAAIQLDLFSYRVYEKRDRLEQAVEALKKKHGDSIVQKAKANTNTKDYS